MILFFYNLLFPFALLLFLPRYFVKMRRRGNYRENFWQRLGFYEAEARRRLSSQKSIVWLHAVSVGEVAVALKLIAQWKNLEPDLFVALTTTTTTGFAFARKEASDAIEVLYSPLDFWPVMRRAFAVIRPRKIVLVEAEVWPNMMRIASRASVPVALVNARLSSRSERRFRKFRRFVAPIFTQLDLVCVPEMEDFARWEALGVAKDRLVRTGNIKFDTEAVRPSQEQIPRAVLDSLGIGRERPIFLGGSTHPSEESILAQIFLRLRAEFPDLFFILAPRHAERAREIEAELAQKSLRGALRSRPISVAADYLLIDTTGELRDWYSVATVVFIGKSLVARGGQNPVEALLAGKPVIFGPHMENFSGMARLLVQHGGARQIQNAEELFEATAESLRNESVRENLVANAGDALAEHRGATDATARLVADLGQK